MAGKSIGISDNDGIYTIRIRCNVSRIIEKYPSDMEEQICNRTRENEDVKNISGIRGISNVSAAAMFVEVT